MSQYQNIVYQIEAEQIKLASLSPIPDSITLHGVVFPIYRGPDGYYILVPAEEGHLRRARYLQWLILEQAATADSVARFSIMSKEGFAEKYELAP